MSFQGLYALSSQSMFVQDVRINTVAGNLVNADVAASSENQVYQTQDVVLGPARVGTLFSASGSSALFGVMVNEIIRSDKPVNVRYQPDHPMADKDGRVFYPAIDRAEQMANMMSAARSFDTAVSLFSTGRQMQDRLIDLINL
ncbi:flagellar basal body rod protein FlgC [Sansalvadorimonas sp. 2012CJ34-2]|uniref:Flagellar basal body rod protein FlgC n=1 Tax=Parendozoicomonas callyspongiae TaxID=2942213 RepID=A0ABT0PDW5_9GAMM|nr:flagellar basal body rod protein FlgC [Sansalvadorimonas sp. 2012CJ34-2]